MQRRSVLARRLKSELFEEHSAMERRDGIIGLRRRAPAATCSGGRRAHQRTRARHAAHDGAGRPAALEAAIADDLDGAFAMELHAYRCERPEHRDAIGGTTAARTSGPDEADRTKGVRTSAGQDHRSASADRFVRRNSRPSREEPS
jgi:hypothetical protein